MREFNKGVGRSEIRNEFSKEGKGLALVNKEEYISWMERLIENLPLCDVVKALKNKQVMNFEDWKYENNYCINEFATYFDINGCKICDTELWQAYERQIKL
tara:strand:- start:1088 stop:1390 length:303 start_codon:yes stop_codon:yes gene_type:complete